MIQGGGHRQQCLIADLVKLRTWDIIDRLPWNQSANAVLNIGRNRTQRLNYPIVQIAGITDQEEHDGIFENGASETAQRGNQFCIIKGGG